MVIIQLFTKFYTSQVVVWDFFHQQYGQIKTEVLIELTCDMTGKVETMMTKHFRLVTRLLGCTRKLVNG